jgi:DNA processing protein
MSDSNAYWVAFNHIKGLGSVRFKAILNYFPTIEDAWEATPAQLAAAGLHNRQIQSMVSFRDANDQSILRKNIEIVTWNDDHYPALLKLITNPPPVLYWRGQQLDNNFKCISIVGTRRMTVYGRMMAEEISAYLAQRKVIIVSGLARGVDSIAHQAALKAGGQTIAVLGSGVDVIYPPEHRTLAQNISNSGAVISDYPPGTQPERTNFPPRNRIISGMSSASIIIEAGEKSGSLITARFAAEQGREVFVLPGNLNAPQSVGTNRLIRDGARPLLQKEELAAFLESFQAENPVELTQRMQISFSDPVEKRIIELIDLEPLHVDEISRRLGMPAGKVSSILTMLELKGFVQETGPQTYRKYLSLF